jgi:ATP synthase F1 gamma subunit
MGKAYKVKKELVSAIELVSLIQTLKDIADNKFYTLTSQKDTFRRFGESFVEFFHMISLSQEKHPLISNQNEEVAIVVVTIEGSFLGEFNNKVVRTAFAQKEKLKKKKSRFIVIGDRKVDQLKEGISDLKVFAGMEHKGLYETAVEVKNYLVEEISSGRLGKVIVCYSWPKDFETQRQRVTKLLPCEDLLEKQTEFTSEFENIIQESDSVEIIGKLCDLWITTRLYAIFLDALISSVAAQAKFLEDRIENMKKEQKKTFVKYRKAKKNDIDTSLRETFAARMLSIK